MGALNEIWLIKSCAGYFFKNLERDQSILATEFEDSGATALVNSARTLRMSEVIFSVGAFSLFESFLKIKTKWDNPLSQLIEFLNSKDRNDLANNFENYKLAINVLKHGDGHSYKTLLKRRSNLNFPIKDMDGFFDEGDMSEIDILIDVNRNFVVKMSDLFIEIDALLSNNIENYY